MKTTKEDRDAIRLDADKAEESSIDWIRERGLRFRRVLSDLSRLAAIEGARAKGGLTSGERAIVPETQGIIIRLDDALKATNEELTRVRGMLAYAVSTYDIKDCPCRRCVNIREYLAEVEASDGR
jgi:hypothetical protein